MITLHPQFIKDANGDKAMVLLPATEFDSIMEELDELEDIRVLMKQKKKILVSEYLFQIT